MDLFDDVVPIVVSKSSLSIDSSQHERSGCELGISAESLKTLSVVVVALCFAKPWPRRRCCRC